MRILGLDPGLARVGYGVLEVDEQRRNQPEMVDCGIISTDAGREEGERMVEIARGLVAKCVNVRFAHQKLSSCKVGDIDAAPSIVLA